MKLKDLKDYFNYLIEAHRWKLYHDCLKDRMSNDNSPEMKSINERTIYYAFGDCKPEEQFSSVYNQHNQLRHLKAEGYQAGCFEQLKLDKDIAQKAYCNSCPLPCTNKDYNAFYKASKCTLFNVFIENYNKLAQNIDFQENNIEE